MPTLLNRRYGVPDMHFTPAYKDGFKYGPYDAFLNFLTEINLVPDAGKKLFRQDLAKPGSIIDFTPARHPAIKDMKMVVHATFPLVKIANAEDYDLELPENGEATLLEQPSTGFFFMVFQEEDGKFDGHAILDFTGSTEQPKKVYISYIFVEEPEIWKPAKPKAEGTRIGGIPLNSDGTPYDGPWPAAEDGKFSFVGQYRLEDGRYIHLFSNDDAENYDYSDMEEDDEDPYSIVLIEGEPAPAGIVMQEGGERKNSSPKNAYQLKTPKSVTKYPPVWIQGDYTPENPEYEFLLQYGPASMYDGECINEEFVSEYYLFWNPKTNEAKVIVQSD